MALKKPTRSDTWRITLFVNHANTGVWDKKTGGELDSDEVKYYPGGMVPAISLGGKVTPGNLTLQREYDLIRDHQKINSLYDAVGRHQCTVHQQPLDADGNVFGSPVTWHGTVKRVQVPDVDSEGNTAALVELEVSVIGKPHMG